MRFIPPFVLVFIAVIFLQAVLDLPYRPRFSSPALNYWIVAALAALTPVLIFLAASTIPKIWVRRTALICAMLLALPCLLVSSCALLEAPHTSEADLSYQPLSEAPTERFVYRLYRTDCGATCANGLELREELDLAFGAKLVTTRWSLYPASEGTLKLDKSSVLVVNKNSIIGAISR